MVASSDYQIVVFQSGSLLYRSKKIYAEKTYGSYRDGNCIHCMLGRHLTREQYLGLQVECFRLDENDEAELIGKTAFVPKLFFKPSPDGHLGFGFDGSYEEIEQAIEWMHKHTNLATLSKFSEKGKKLLFDGRQIKRSGAADDSVGTISVSSFSDLPDSPDGTLAYVENDSFVEALDESDLRIEPFKQYPKLALRPEYPDDTLEVITTIVKGRSDTSFEAPMYQFYGQFERTDGEERLYFEFMYLPNTIALLLIGGIPEDEEFQAYIPGGRKEQDSEVTYCYNFLPGFDVSLLTEEDAPRIMPVGWYDVRSKRVNIRIENNYIEYDYETAIMPIEIAESNLSRVFSDCSIEVESDDVEINLNTMPELLIKIFRCSVPTLQKSGLYLRVGELWQQIQSGDLSVVSGKLDLPKNAAEGDLALVRNSEYIYDTYSGHYASAYGSFSSVYVNSHLNIFSRLFDFELSAVFETSYNNEAFVPSNGGFELLTNIENNYVLLAMSPSEWDSRRDYYVYSWLAQTVRLRSDSNQVNNLSVELSEGWNKLNFDYYGNNFYGAVPIKNPGDLPCLRKHVYPEQNQQGRYRITHCTSPQMGAYGFTQHIVSNYPFCELNNAAGLWGFFGGEWQKLENNLLYNFRLENH